MAIRICPPGRLLIAAHARTPSFVNVPVYTVTFTAVGYKRQLKHIRAVSLTHLSGEALISMYTF